MNFEPQMAAMTWAAAKSVAQAEKSLSGIGRVHAGLARGPAGQTLMKTLLIALFIGATATTAHATHLLHKLPADVAETIQRDCKQRWPNSAFDAGACVDQEAEVWLDAQQKGELPKFQPPAPDLLGKSPDLLIRPTPEDSQ